jgi:hypothetical protein
MLRFVPHSLYWLLDKRCPSCSSAQVRRSQSRNYFEVRVLPCLLARPFRCESCGNRFYALAFRRRVPVLDNAKVVLGPPQDLPVLVYGRRKDEEPFQEETNVRLLNLRGGLITLTTSVEPGQQLILMNATTDEDQRCRVAFVGGQHLGRSMVGIQFSPHAREFWHIATQQRC